MKNIAFGQYYPVDSVIHRMDPRAKIVMSVLYIICTFICKNTFAFALLTVMTVISVLLSRIPLKTVLLSIKPLLFILILTSFINVFMSSGEQLLTPEHWRVKIYAEGLWNALFMVLRIVALLISTGVFLSFTTTPIALTDAMEELLAPLKKIHVPVHDIAMMTTIAMRFIPTLMEETEKIMNAQKSRGANFNSGGLVQRAKALLPVFIPLLSSAFKRADELANAMDCRCYNGGEGRTKLKVLHLHRTDVVGVIWIVILGVGIVVLNRVGIGYTMR